MAELEKGVRVRVNDQGPVWAVGRTGTVDTIRPHRAKECSEEGPPVDCVEVVLDGAETKNVGRRKVKRTYKFTPDCLDPEAPDVVTLPPAPEDLARAA